MPHLDGVDHGRQHGLTGTRIHGRPRLAQPARGVLEEGGEKGELGGGVGAG